MRSFFERVACALEDAPDRIMRYGNAPIGQHVLELVQRQVRNLFNLRQHEVAVRLEAASLMAIKLRQLSTPRLRQTLGPFDHRRRGELVLMPGGFHPKQPAS